MMAEYTQEEQSAESEDPKNTSCGLGSYAPIYLQKFANPKVFLIFFCITGLIQGASFTYLIGISSTLEKRFSYDSKLTAVILLADNISPAIFSIIMGYYGKYIHRPRLVSCGLMINVLSCFIACIPYLTFGSEITSSSAYSKKNFHLCPDPESTENCEEVSSKSSVAVSLLFTSNFLKGIGSTAFYSVGTPYLDDIVKKKNSPIYLVEPNFGTDDSQWIGAWWLGFIIIGGSLLLLSFVFCCFPRYMESQKNQKRSEIGNSSIWDLYLSLKGLMRNPILMFHTLSIIFQINGLFGYLSYMPKYVENQYHKTASSASFYSGIVFFASAPVAFFSGLCVSKFKPKPKFLTGYMLFVQVFAALVMISALFLYCQSNPVIENEFFLYNTNKECNSMCSCNRTSFSPICDIYDVNHFSPCSAGCQVAEDFNKKVTFNNCSCIPGNDNSTSQIIQATKGICSGDCSKFFPYIIGIVASRIFVSSARVGNILVTLRCVDENDKTLALGATEFLISMFASIPNPLIYGFFIDKSCLLWEETCKYQGNCLLYDNDKLRYYLHGITLIFICFGAICDFVVFLLSSKIKNFYGENEPDRDRNLELIESNDVNQN